MSAARRPKTKYQDVTVTVKMPAEFRDILDSWAVLHQVSRSGMIRMMIERQVEAVANATARATKRLSERDTRVADGLADMTEALNKDAMQVQKIGINYNQQMRAARAKNIPETLELHEVRQAFDEHNALLKKISDDLALLARQ